MVSETNVTVGLIVVFLIVGFIFAPPLIASGMGALREIFAEFRDAFFEDWGGDDFFNGNKTQGDNATSYDFNGIGYFGAMVRYRDGSQRSFKLTSPLSIFPLTVWDTSGFISSITIEFWVTTEYSLSPASYSLSGTLTVDEGTTDASQTFTKLHTFSTTTVAGNEGSHPLQSGVAKKMWSKAFNEDTLNAWYSSAYGEYGMNLYSSLRYSGDVDITYYWGDGHSESKTLHAESIHGTFWSEADIGSSRLESVSFTINPTAFYK